MRILRYLWGLAVGSAPAAMSASAATLGASALCGLIENRNALAPINAIAHAFHGSEAFESASSTCTARNLARYTLPAVLWNTLAMGGWAMGHRLLAGKRPSLARSLAAAVAVSALAYVVDYKLAPPRWRPGIEVHLSPRSLLVAYVALALGLALAPGQSEPNG